MSHAYAYGMGVMVPLLSGASMATMRRFSPRLVHDACEQLGVTIFPAVPMMLEMLLFGGRKLGGAARCVLTAGSPLPERTARDFRKRFGIAVRPLYGTTETGGIAVAPADGEPLFGEVVGPAMRGVSAEVRFSGPTAELGRRRGNTPRPLVVDDGRLPERRRVGRRRGSTTVGSPPATWRGWIPPATFTSWDARPR